MAAADYDGFINGNAYTMTGASYDEYGTTWHEVILVEGREAGSLKVISERQRQSALDNRNAAAEYASANN